jgi:hypothetical protein
MKRIALALALAALTFAASAALACVQPTHLPQAQRQTFSPTLVPDDGLDSTSGTNSLRPGSDAYRRPSARPPRDRPPSDATTPATEPGTMMLASMGLLALGAAGRRQRHKD